MNTLINFLDGKEILNSYNFARLADIVFSEIVTRDQFHNLKSKNTKIIEEDDLSVFYVLDEINIQEGDVIFTNTYLLDDLFEKLYSSKLKNIKLITSQTDHIIDKKRFVKKPKCISKWYSINVVHEHKDLISIPLGLANDYSPKNLSKENFSNLSNNDEKINKLYLNFEQNTNYFHRNKLKNKLTSLSFVSTEDSLISNQEYITKLSKYKFILCPWGNGIDTHRVWETLYAGSIPIIPRHKMYSSLFGESIFLFDNYLEIENIINKINITDYSFKRLEMLKMNYWSSVIIPKTTKSTHLRKEKIKFDIKGINNNLDYLRAKESKLKKIKTLQRKIHKKFFNF